MSAIPVHELAGLKPEALASYLSALGVLRLVAEQKDEDARGFWRNERFVLVTRLDWEELLKYFCEEYRPTPILAPWNLDSGFYSLKPSANQEGDEQGEDEAAGDPLIGGLRNSTAARFAPMRDAIEVAFKCTPPAVRQLESEIRQGLQRNEEQDAEFRQAAEKRTREAKDKLKDELAGAKFRMICDLRLRWGDAARQWLDAALALEGRDKGIEFAPIFGSGGNDGRMEFTRNFRRHLAALFDFDTGLSRQNAAERLAAAMLGKPANVLIREAVGQFYPGRAGGANMAIGFSGDAVINPWEFVLMLEGAVALVSGVTRRGDTGRPRVSSPFWVEAAAAGFASASEFEGSPRGEQWLPIWFSPLLYSEAVELIREGRAQISRSSARRASDIVRSAARLGLARGIEALQRFAYLERYGRSNLAVSAGRFYVTSRPNQELLGEVAAWIDHLSLCAKDTKDNKVPKSLTAISGQVQEAMFSVCRRDATAEDWRELLIVLGRAELALLRSGGNLTRRPLPLLSPEWLRAVDDNTESGRTILRLALALASQHSTVLGAGRYRYQGSVRHHFLALQDSDSTPARFLLEKQGQVKRDPEWVCVGRDLVSDALALLHRRSIWARRPGNEGRTPRLPLLATRGCEATPGEVAWWLRNPQYDRLILDLVRPLLALNWLEVGGNSVIPRPMTHEPPAAVQLVFRLAHLPFDIPIRAKDGAWVGMVTVRFDPEPLQRLSAGDLDGALRIVVRRLAASGVRPVVQRTLNSASLARRIAASLALPISQDAAAYAAQLVCKPYDWKDPETELSVTK